MISSGKQTADRAGIVVGRSSECDWQIDDQFVSGVQFTIETPDAKNVYVLRDRNSTYGTRINGVSVNAKVLEHGDTISIGMTEMTYEVTGSLIERWLSSRQPPTTLFFGIQFLGSLEFSTCVYGDCE